MCRARGRPPPSSSCAAPHCVAEGPGPRGENVAWVGGGGLQGQTTAAVIGATAYGEGQRSCGARA